MEGGYLNEFNKLCKEIEENSNQKIDGKALACICKLVFFSGLLRKEIPLLKIGDLVDQYGKVVERIRCFPDPISLPKEMQSEIESYIDYLKDRDPALVNPESPLFPDYPYEEKAYRQLRDNFYKNFKDIRQGGIKHLNYQYREAGVEEQKAYEKVAEQFRLSPREIRDVVHSKIQPAGKTKDSRAQYRIFQLFDEVESLKRSEPNLNKKILSIKDELDEIAKNVEARWLQDQVGKIRNSLVKKMNSMVGDKRLDKPS
jgi:hypothetical protein